VRRAACARGVVEVMTVTEQQITAAIDAAGQRSGRMSRDDWRRVLERVVPSSVFVSLVFPDDEAMQASRISLIGVGLVAPPDRDDQLIVPVTLDGELVDLDDAADKHGGSVACTYCLDYLHTATDAHPELAGVWFDSSGDPVCVARPLDDGGLGQPHVVFADSVPDHLWPCGCLRNDADAHRVGCPLYPEGREGS